MLGLDLVGVDPRGDRPMYLFAGHEMSSWDLRDVDVPLFTLLLAIDADQHTDEQVTSLAGRMGVARIGFCCAWGPGCGSVHALFDIEAVDAEASGAQRPFVMTTSHEDETLAEALWFAVDVAFHEDWPGPQSPLIVGTDRDDWEREIRLWLGDVEALRRSVLDDDDDDDQPSTPRRFRRWPLSSLRLFGLPGFGGSR